MQAEGAQVHVAIAGVQAYQGGAPYTINCVSMHAMFCRHRLLQAIVYVVDASDKDNIEVGLPIVVPLPFCLRLRVLVSALSISDCLSFLSYRTIWQRKAPPWPSSVARNSCGNQRAVQPILSHSQTAHAPILPCPCTHAPIFHAPMLNILLHCRQHALSYSPC